MVVKSMCSCLVGILCFLELCGLGKWTFASKPCQGTKEENKHYRAIVLKMHDYNMNIPIFHANRY